MIEAYRIEHPEDSWGIWRSKWGWNGNSDNISFTDDLIQHHDAMPSPPEDPIIARFIKSDEFCAFKSFEDLSYWIKSEWLPELYNLGFKIYKLTLNKAVIGDSQILFKAKHIINKQEIEL